MAVARKTWIAVFSGVALAGLLGLSIGTERVLWLVPLMAVPVVAAAVWHPRLTLQATVVLAYFVNYVVYLFNLPSETTYVVDGLVLVLVCAVMLQAAVRHEVRWGSPVLVLWVFLVVLAAILGRRQGLYAVQSMMGYVVFPLLFLAIINVRMGRITEGRLVRILLALAFLQVPVTLIQKYAFGLTNVDRIGGTLGRAGTPAMAVVMAVLFAFVLSYLASHRSWKAFPLLFVPIVPMLLGEAKAGFVLASLGAAIVLPLLVWRERSWRSLGLAVVSIVLPLGAAYAAFRCFPAVIFSDSSTGAHFLQKFSTFEGVVDYLSGYQGGQAGRLTSFDLIWRNLSDSGAVALGQGPGALSTSTLLGEAATPTLSGLMWTPSAGRYLLETGLAGLVVFCLSLVHLFGHSARLVRSPDTYQRLLGVTFVAAGAIFLIGGFYASVWHTDSVAVSFWCLAGLAYRRTRSFNKRIAA